MVTRRNKDKKRLFFLAGNVMAFYNSKSNKGY